MSDTIKRISLPPFLPKGKDKKQKPVSSKEGITKAMKEVGRSQKHNDIARSRGIPMREILQFDHADDNFLFDGECTSKPEKHKIISELEKYLENEDYNLVKENNQLTAIIVDFMLLIRKVPFTKVKTIGEALESAWKIIMNISKAEEIHIVFDSYIENSLKESERVRGQFTKHWKQLTCLKLHQFP